MVNLIDTEPASNTTQPNPLMAILFFFIVTCIYCIISLFLTDTKQRFIAKVCYVLFVITGEYFINLNLSESMCGLRQWQTTFFITIIPWMLIFILMHLFIVMFPGWLTPFSNTFGYLVAKLMGLPDLMTKILRDNSVGSPEAIRALESVRTDNALLINELYAEANVTERDPKDGTPIVVRKKFTKAWDKLVDGNLIKPEFKSTTREGQTMLNKLYYYVNMKFTIAEFIWNILTGSLVTSISYNYIIGAGCAKSPREMKDRYDQYEADQAKKQRANQKHKANQPEYSQS